MPATGLISALADDILDGTAPAIATTFVWIQLHTDHPGAAGTANVATESTRVSTTWGTPSGGSMASTVDTEWLSVAATEDYTHYSAWSASTAGTCGFTGTVTANQVTLGDDFRIAAGNLVATFPVATT